MRTGVELTEFTPIKIRIRTGCPVSRALCFDDDMINASYKNTRMIVL